jgi:hypothetical protein
MGRLKIGIATEGQDREEQILLNNQFEISRLLEQLENKNEDKAQ